MNNVNGLHLWSVWCNQLHEDDGNLWITTRTRDAAIAIGRARAFVKKTHTIKNPTFSKIEYEGTIDV